MANAIDFTLKLVSDAEPSSGLGTQLVDSLIPRNFDGAPILPSSHLKGLMKQALLDVDSALSPTGLGDLIDKAFGAEGDSDQNSGACFFLSDAVAPVDTAITTVSRTSLNEFGVAKSGSLRTTEAVASGTEFAGTLVFTGSPSPLLDTLVRYALLSVMEVGGSRSRGCGACAVEIPGENRTPGVLLKELTELLGANSADLLAEAPNVESSGTEDKPVTLRLTFTADSDICLPDRPVVGTNTISSGFSISASAVQGMILTRINALNKAVADACFESELFRAWPLQPVAGESDKIPVRVSTSHKISKLPVEEGEHVFCDAMIEEYDWDKTPKNAPLKAADGVLCSGAEGVALWRSADMPRSLSAHGVVNGPDGKRNLYTVESMAVKRFQGVVVLPENAANLLLESLKDNATVQVGKGRSVRGSGELRAEPVESLADVCADSQNSKNGSVFIVQSPMLVEKDTGMRSVGEMIKEIVADAGWGEVVEAAGSVAVMFGWNRHGGGRQTPVAVIEPGSVFRLKSTPDNLTSLLVKGIGDGRKRGCGAVLPHPGIAKKRYEPNPAIPEISRDDNGPGVRGYNLWKASKALLSASQISQVWSLAGESTDAALHYLEKQRTDRPARIWDRWKGVINPLKEELKSHPKQAAETLKVWHDLAVAAGGKGGNA